VDKKRFLTADEDDNMDVEGRNLGAVDGMRYMVQRRWEDEKGDGRMKKEGQGNVDVSKWVYGR